jgi:hypothetical protein
MVSFSTRKKRLAALVAAAAIVAVGGVAYAYWSSTGGTGTGTATTGTSSGFSVESSDPSGGPLTPGGPAQTVAFTVTNLGTGAQNLSHVAVTVANPNGSPWVAVAGCSALDYAVAAPTITYGDITGNGSRAGTVVITMNNLAANQDACKNVAVPLYFAAS